MILEVPSFNKSTINKISDFNVEDMKTISFMIENDSNSSVYNLLMSKVTTKCRGFDKFNLLLEARIKYIDDIIVFNNGKNNVTYNLNIWKDILSKNYVDIEKVIKFNNISVTVDYPQELYFETITDIILNCIKTIEINDKIIDYQNLSKIDRQTILEKLPYGIIDEIKDFVGKHSTSVILLEPVLDLPEIAINFFDNSAFSVVKTIFSYYAYNDILELIFILSKRLPDSSFLLHSTPRDLTFLSKLYSEEVEKQTAETN